ncbi:MAG: HAMP domain-containing sensor histidine kinase [Acidimicrobiia bacterium]
MRRRVFWAMVAVAVATLVVGGFTATILVGRSFAEDRRDEFYRQAEATARVIEAPLQRQGEFRGRPLRDIGELQALLEVSRVIGGHDHVEATLNTPGGVLPLADDDALLRSLPEEALQPGGGGQYKVHVDGVDTLALVRQLELTPGATVIVGIGSTEDLVPWRDVAFRLILGLGVGVVLAAVLARRLAASTGRRLDGLATTASALADGDLSARAATDGSDEVAQLGLAFNDMASRLETGKARERDFLMSVGHDLRTPLTTIKGYAEALASGAIGTEKLPEIAGSLEAQSDRLARLVEDLMLLSRLEAQEFTLRPEEVDLAAHLGEVSASFEQRAAAGGLDLELEIDDVGVVTVDPDRVAQILNNLIENALRYTPEDGTITVRLQRIAGGVRFAVGDTGAGIDAEDLPHVFDRLYVAEHYRALRPEGSGLGLNLVKVLAEAMDGSAAVESSVEGTVVTVELGD